MSTFQRGQAQARRPFAVVGIAVLVALGLGSVAAVMLMNSGSSGSKLFKDDGNAGAITTKIVVELADGTKCFRGTFNNATGQLSGGQKDHCEKPILDSAGVALPSGTIHRLDSIQRSFFNR